MPSVGSTPTTTSPAPQQQQQQQALPQHHNQHHQQKQHNSATTTTSSTSSITSSSSLSNPTNVKQLTQHQPQQQQLQLHHQQQFQRALQHIKLKQQQQAHSLPLQLQYQHYQPQQQQQQQLVTTTQPSPAGIFNMPTTAVLSHVGGGGDISPISSTNSFSSVDTNRTLLHTIGIGANSQQHHVSVNRQSSAGYQPQQQRTAHNSSSSSSKYSQFMIITPAVSIDRDFDYKTTADNNEFEDAFAAAAAAAQNGNILRMSVMQSGNGSVDSGNSSDSSLHSNYNSYLHHSRQHLLPKSGGAPHHFYTFTTSWRWCSLICAAMRCFGGGHSSNAHYSSSFVRPSYQHHRSRSTAAQSSNMPHRRLRSSSSFTAETAFEHFSAPFKPRKTRDHMNNITYEL